MPRSKTRRMRKNEQHKRCIPFNNTRHNMCDEVEDDACFSIFYPMDDICDYFYHRAAEEGLVPAVSK